MTDKGTQTRPAPKRSTARKTTSKRRRPTHAQISKRAYYIHLQEGETDEIANWLRAERELMVA